MDTEAISVDSIYQVQKKDDIDINKMDIKNFAIINLKVESGSDAEQYLIQEVKDFDPNLVYISKINVPKLWKTWNYYDKCTFMDYFFFVKAFFYKNINSPNLLDTQKKQLIITDIIKQYYYIGKEIDFHTYQKLFWEDYNAQCPNLPSDMNKYIKDEINNDYNEWINGKKIFYQNYYFPKIVDAISSDSKIIKPNENIKEKQKIKTYTAIIPTVTFFEVEKKKSLV